AQGGDHDEAVLPRDQLPEVSDVSHATFNIPRLVPLPRRLALFRLASPGGWCDVSSCLPGGLVR
ncbi:MAG TPA: hypothetical protein VI365_30010, partial [Trebonia sp.]